MVGFYIMERIVVEVYFADIDVVVKIRSPNKGFINTLTQKESEILSQLIYMTLNGYQYIRAMSLREDKKPKDKDGG